MANASRPLLILSGLIGAAGVALAARGSHGGEGNLAIAANFMLLHAAALIGISMLARLSLAAGFVLVAGLALFCGDLIMRATVGTPLFPMAAPAGGFVLIAGWLVLAFSGFWRR